VLRRLVHAAGDGLESRAPADWPWLGRRVKIADGTTLLTPDTPENQQAWPQARTQKSGVGFPILRMVVLVSLATAALCGAAIVCPRRSETCSNQRTVETVVGDNRQRDKHRRTVGQFRQPVAMILHRPGLAVVHGNADCPQWGNHKPPARLNRNAVCQAGWCPRAALC
jgi:hypothetical protein